MNSVPTTQEPSARFSRLVIAEICLTLIVILGGAFVRASGSGAGCGEHWPLCNGQAIPLNPKLETVIEFTHRITSGASLLVFVAIFFLLRKAYTPDHASRAWARVALVSFVLEAGIGAFLVLKKLVATDTSSLRAFVIALHLVNTLVLLGGLVGILWNLRARQGRAVRPTDLGRRWVLLFSAWGVVGALGAIVALGDTLFPAESLTHGFQQDLDPLSHPLVRLRALHPVLAMVVSVYTVVVTLPRFGERASKAALGVRALIVTQLLCGVANWLLLAPTWMQMLHLLLADLTWVVLVWMGLEQSVKPPAKGMDIPLSEKSR